MHETGRKAWSAWADLVMIVRPGRNFNTSKERNRGWSLQSFCFRLGGPPRPVGRRCQPTLPAAKTHAGGCAAESAEGTFQNTWRLTASVLTQAGKPGDIARSEVRRLAPAALIRRTHSAGTVAAPSPRWLETNRQCTRM